jgi:hypothetical protein
VIEEVFLDSCGILPFSDSSIQELGERYRVPPTVADSGNPTPHQGHDGVLEFVAFFYEFIRDDEAMVRVLDRALKKRYGPA